MHCNSIPKKQRMVLNLWPKTIKTAAKNVPNNWFISTNQSENKNSAQMRIENNLNELQRKTNCCLPNRGNNANISDATIDFHFIHCLMFMHLVFFGFFVQPISGITAWVFESKRTPFMDIDNILDMIWRGSSQKCVLYLMEYYLCKCNICTRQ